MNYEESIKKLKENEILTVKNEAESFVSTVSQIGKNPNDQKMELALSFEEIKLFISFTSGVDWHYEEAHQRFLIHKKILRIWQKIAKQLLLEMTTESKRSERPKSEAP